MISSTAAFACGLFLTFQLSGRRYSSRAAGSSLLFAALLSIALKKGRKMMYAVASFKRGNTRRVPSFVLVCDIESQPWKGRKTEHCPGPPYRSPLAASRCPCSPRLQGSCRCQSQSPWRISLQNERNALSSHLSTPPPSTVHGRVSMPNQRSDEAVQH